MATTTPEVTQEHYVRPRRATTDKYLRVGSQKILPRVILVVMCAGFILPFYWMAALGLKSNEELSVYPPTLYPHNPIWSNIREATEVFPFWRFAWNTTVITVLTIVGAIISNPIIAYGFSRIDWPGGTRCSWSCSPPSSCRSRY